MEQGASPEEAVAVAAEAARSAVVASGGTKEEAARGADEAHATFGTMNRLQQEVDQAQENMNKAENAYKQAERENCTENGTLVQVGQRLVDATSQLNEAVKEASDEYRRMLTDLATDY